MLQSWELKFFMQYKCFKRCSLTKDIQHDFSLTLNNFYHYFVNLITLEVIKYLKYLLKATQLYTSFNTINTSLYFKKSYRIYKIYCQGKIFNLAS